ncbi:MAG: hypothetical protein IKP98_02840 [Bacilli bacterium]|nr:hypothetical protein [Bacilli bacterium]
MEAEIMKVDEKKYIATASGAVSEKKYNYEYALPTLDVVRKRIETFLEKHSDIAKELPSYKTKLGYDVRCIQIGNGPKELFIVGGTHSNEIITVDVVSQFLNRFDEDFDKSLLDDVTINIIPIQNPEGYFVLDTLMNEINDYIERNDKISLQGFCYDYYINYRTDSLVYLSFKHMNEFMNEEEFIPRFRDFIINDKIYKRLHEKQIEVNGKKVGNSVFPVMNRELGYADPIDHDTMMMTFDNRILSINPDLPIKDYLKEVRNVITDTKEKVDSNDQYNIGFIKYLDLLFDALLTVPLRPVKLEEIPKSHHDMLRDASLNALLTIRDEIEKAKNNVPDLKLALEHSLLMTCTRAQASSIIGEFASNVSHNVNLNGNTIYSPGIEKEKNEEKDYSKNASIANLRNYYRYSPLGSSVIRKLIEAEEVTEDNMIYEPENQMLLDLLSESTNNGSYGACILAHSTGGEIYHRPNEELTGENYDNFSEFNDKLATSMQDSIDEAVRDLDPERAEILEKSGGHYYRKRDDDDNTGFGDYLRGRYPGVILLENSVMGGNPFGPYGDVNNYVRTVASFNAAVEGACKTLALTNRDILGGKGSK